MFVSEADRLEFIDTLAAAARKASLQIWAYALMRNHVHMIAVPGERESVSDAMGRCLDDYAHAFNARHGQIGDLWHTHCHCAMIRPGYLWEAVRYVERNPVRAGIVARSEDYRWSSAAYHCGRRDADPLVLPASPLRGALADWSSWLEEPDRDGQLAYLRRRNRMAQPDQQLQWTGVLERALDRRISCWERSRGRPRKSDRVNAGPNGSRPPRS